MEGMEFYQETGKIANEPVFPVFAIKGRNWVYKKI